MKVKHYIDELPVEAIEIIDSVGNSPKLNEKQRYAIKNAQKYLLRLGKKDDVMKDLYKVLDYVHRAYTGKWYGDKT